MRGFVVVGMCAALALAAQHADAKANHGQASAQNGVTASLQNISPRDDEDAQRAHRPDTEDQPCGPERYRSNADLCAQWKAADAAADSAWWAWASGVVGLFSLIGVIAAVGTALHSNLIARDTAKKELRAYMGILNYRVTPMNYEGAPVGTGGVMIQMQNFGQTPAIELVTVISIGFRQWGEVPEIPEKWEFEGEELPIDVPPSGPMHREVALPEATFEHYFDLPAGKVALYVQVKAAYSDIFKKRHEQTTLFYSRGRRYADGEMIVAEQSRET